MDAITEGRIGRVVSLLGAKVIFLLDQDTTGEAGFDGLQIGVLVKIQSARHVAIGMVTGLSIPMPKAEASQEELRICELELVGELTPDGDGDKLRFRRGLSITPSLGDAVARANQADIGLVYAPPSDSIVEIGTIQQEASLPAYAVVDGLLGRHFAILGTTGCGKSCALSLILHRLMAAHDSAHVVLLDPHGEYAKAFGSQAECMEPGDFNIPVWLFNFEELAEIVFGRDPSDYAQEIAVLRDLVQRAKQMMAREDKVDFSITADTPVPFKMGDISRMLDEEAGKLDNRSEVAPYLRVRNRLNALQNDRRYAFIFQGSMMVRDNMAQLLSRIFRVPVDGKPLSILNLSGVPSEILNVVVSILCRMTFDFAHWGDQETPILLVCEEAHRYAPANDDSFESTRRALARIAKEGRKYGVSLGIVSQRPSELDPRILSQCNSIFAMRMTNERDQEIVQATLSEVSSALIDSLPSLGNAEAIAVGDGVAVPMRVAFSRLTPEQQPRSATARFSEAWKSGAQGHTEMQTIVNRWRRQRR
ncbi:MAG: ATP-binding protein [Magnetospiraceae bacterium]